MMASRMGDWIALHKRGVTTLFRQEAMHEQVHSNGDSTEATKLSWVAHVGALCRLKVYYIPNERSMLGS